MRRLIYKLADYMEFVLTLFVLVGLPLYFGFRHFVEYESFSHKLWGTPEKVATFMFLSYVILFLTIGKEAIYNFSDTIRDSRKFGTFFFLPGLGFAFAMFPRIAAEYSEKYIELARTGNLRTVGIAGWVEICWLYSILVF